MKIKINGLVWKIVFLGSKDDRLVLNGERCLGITEFADRRIYIANDTGGQVFKETVRHELTHAFLYSSGYDEKLSGGDNVEEAVCEFAERYVPELHRLSRKIIGKRRR